MPRRVPRLVAHPGLVEPPRDRTPTAAERAQRRRPRPVASSDGSPGRASRRRLPPRVSRRRATSGRSALTAPVRRGEACSC